MPVCMVVLWYDSDSLRQHKALIDITYRYSLIIQL